GISNSTSTLILDQPGGSGSGFPVVTSQAGRCGMSVRWQTAAGTASPRCCCPVPKTCATKWAAAPMTVHWLC
ncbi:hypothetical protein HaLaN_04598, partial [Haematococcus lacustris]